MIYRRLGKTGLEVSEIGFGGEWLERHNGEECKAVIDRAQSFGINILDCWMSNPEVRTNIGNAIKGSREKWYIQGHIGSTWQNGQYVRTRKMSDVIPAFEDLLARLQTDYIDLGMIHYVDDPDEWDRIVDGEFYAYVKNLKDSGVIRHIGMSTHNPIVAKKAALSGIVEMILFSINPAFDMLPATDNLDDYFTKDTYVDGLGGVDPQRAELYKLCEENDIGITVMKGFAGGRLFSADASPFGIALTPIQCIHYALTKPAVASILIGYDTPEHVDEAVGYETASDEAKDFAATLAKAPKHACNGQCTYCGHCKPCPVNIDIAMVNKFYDLATMQSQVPQSVKAHYESLDHHASECIGCHGCEKRCPFGVKIVERMKETAKLFKI